MTKQIASFRNFAKEPKYSYLLYNQCDALEVMLANITDRLIIHVLTVANNIEKTVKLYSKYSTQLGINPLNPELNPICYLLALLGAHHFLHVSRIRVKLLTLRLLMSYIYGAPILDVSRSHTTTQHSR